MVSYIKHCLNSNKKPIGLFCVIMDPKCWLLESINIEWFPNFRMSQHHIKCSMLLNGCKNFMVLVIQIPMFLLSPIFKCGFDLSTLTHQILGLWCQHMTLHWSHRLVVLYQNQEAFSFFPVSQMVFLLFRMWFYPISREYVPQILYYQYQIYSYNLIQRPASFNSCKTVSSFFTNVLGCQFIKNN